MHLRPSDLHFPQVTDLREGFVEYPELSGLPALKMCQRLVAGQQAEISQLALRCGRVYNLARYLTPTLLYVAGASLRLDAASGIDEVTPRRYRRRLASHIAQLHKEVKDKSYQPQPVRRVTIPKDDGSSRYIGVPVCRDKHLQRAVLIQLEAIYEPNFYEHSYGFRPHRSGRMAMQVLRNWLSEHDGGQILEIDCDYGGKT